MNTSPSSPPSIPSFPVLLAAAARTLEKVGEVLPVTVTCDRSDRWLPPVAISPASLDLPAADQIDLVHQIAARLGWSTSPVVGGDGAIASGTVDDVQVQVLAAPLSGPPGPAPFPSMATTAEHAALLRALCDWSATLPEQATSVIVRPALDDIEASGDLTVYLTMSSQQAAATLPDLILDAGKDRWSGFRGSGVLPTGHTLTVMVNEQKERRV
ncbi:hypothetical protein ACIBF1_44085 [Spirillospora sp. NPDC050679]